MQYCMYFFLHVCLNTEIFLSDKKGNINERALNDRAD
jgi:hypothetical protein